jgi:spermidine synthase
MDALSESDSRLLQSFGLWPRLHADTPPGSPYISNLGDSRSLHFDHRTIQSSMCMSDPLSLEFDYIRVMMGFLLFDPEPRAIDMIGLGGGSLAKYCYYKVPSSFVTAIEVSREVIALRRRFFIPDDNRRLRVLCCDGADYVRQSKRKADVLLVDGFDANGQPPQLCSQRFYDDCFDHLAPGGILVANLWEKHHLCIGRLREAFGCNLVVVHTEGGDNRAVFARKGDNPVLVPDYAALIRVQGERHAGFLPQVARRIEKEITRRDLISSVGRAIGPAFPAGDRSAW